MSECPHCGEILRANSATCRNCKMPIAPNLPTPMELAAQTTKPLQKLLARSPEPYPQDKHNPFDTRKHTLAT